MVETKLKIGKWAGVLSAIFSIVWFVSFRLLEGYKVSPEWTDFSILAHNLNMVNPIYIYQALLFSITYVVLLTCLHLIVDEGKQLWTLIALVLGVVYAVATNLNYNLEAISIRMNMANLGSQGLEMLILKNKDSIFGSITSSNNFLVISMFFTGFIFDKEKLGRWIKLLFFAQIIPLIARMGYNIFNMHEHIYIGANMVFVVGAPLAFVLMAIWLRKKMRLITTESLNKEEYVQIPLMFL